MIARAILSVAAALCCCIAQGQVRDAFGGILPVTDKGQQVSLNGEWSLKVVKGIGAESVVPQKDATWGRIPVPGCWEVYGFCEPRYDKADSLTGYYRTTFRVPSAWKGQRVVLRFDGVLYGYDLWINGKASGSWRSGYNTALFDVTSAIDWRKSEQELAMRVITRFPGSDFDYNDDWAPSGIFRDVSMFAVPKIHISDLTIKPDNSGKVDVALEVAGRDKNTVVEHEILDAQGKRAGTTSVSNPHLWTAETPYLYTLRTTLKHKGATLQTFEHRFGFRQLSIDGNVLKLNGRPVKLRGVTCHSTDPRTAKVISDELTLLDMKLMKEASVNYIRTSHYPREPRFYELADSLGFYVIDEVPFGYGDKNLSDSTFYPVLQQRAQATIRRDKNHACVLIWSLGNENPLTKICEKLGGYVKTQLDTSRPVCYPQVGSYFRKFEYKFPAVADIYTPHYPTTGQIGGFYQKADRPVIFTEYCHTLGISFEDHNRQWETIERTPCIAGGSVWEWVDQGMPFKAKLDDRYGYEERVFTSEDGGFEMYGNKGTDGLLYADRTPLPNYYELQHNYARAFVSDSVYDGTLNVVNRYDFINLKDNVTFRWELTADCDVVASGAFSPDCEPHSTADYKLALPANLDTRKMCLLSLEVCDAAGRVFLRQSLPVGKHDVVSRVLGGLDVPTPDAVKGLSEAFLFRVGRKATMAEKIKVGDKRYERYLVRNLSGGEVRTEKAGNATKCTFTIEPEANDMFLSELGVAFLLPEEVDRVRWIGQGPMPTYPGRYKANRLGRWAMHSDDLYFEGNRMGVSAALLTDAKGEGTLVVCQDGNVSFEKTDKGIVVTVNAAVSGQGPKFARTAFPVLADKVGKVSGEFYLYHVDAKHVPTVVKELFGEVSGVPKANNPFLTQYDTYLMRYDDIVK